MYRTNTLNAGKNKAAIVHDPGIEPLFTGVESLLMALILMALSTF